MQVSGVVNGALSTQVKPPGEEVTVYELISAPPLLLGAVNVTTALVFPATALTEVTKVGFVLELRHLMALKDQRIQNYFVQQR